MAKPSVPPPPRLDSPSAPRPPLWGSSITLRYTTLSGLLWMNDQPITRPLPDNTQHLQETDIHSPSKPSTWAATDPCLRPCGQWDQLKPGVVHI